ncbi:MAG: ATP-NAD kinase family protein [Paracoccaceae bacterium]|nr:ATP-NAD kinase family protein [Paracoccaceae bacterium]
MSATIVKIGFLINPVAGMGGKIGLKGTDGLADEAVRLGATPIAADRALASLKPLKALISGRRMERDLDWVTCSGAMGGDALRITSFESIEIVHQASSPTTVDDTVQAVQSFLEAGVDLILFCGGDGTARDIATATAKTVPILGIPSGVKMYSGVFGITPERVAKVVFAFLEGRVQAAEADLLDLDEERYRCGEWVIRPVGSALTPFEPTLTQTAKAFAVEASEAQAKAEIADDLRDQISACRDTVFLFGPGTTVQSVAEHVGVEKTLLGIDAFLNGRLVERDLNERAILRLLGDKKNAVLVLSPIGAQGFVLGRGNLQLSPEVIRRIGTGNIVVVATPAKLQRTPVLHFDTGDAALDRELGRNGYLSVVIGYHLRRMVPVG